MSKILHLILCTAALLLPAVSSAVEPAGNPVSWTSESYRAYAYTDFIDNSNPQSNEEFGPPLPVSAYQSMGTTSASSYIDSAYMTVLADSASTSEISEAIAEFTGSYTASNPYFSFSYTFPGSVDWDPAEGWLTITDTDSSSVLYSYTFSGYGTDTGTISVNTPVGHNIEVNFGLNAFASPSTSRENARLDYAMAVAPEPMSMILFVTGSMVLSARRMMKRMRQV